MNLNSLRLKNQAEKLLFSITKLIYNLLEQSETEPQEILEIGMKKPTETFPFDFPPKLEDEWMLGLTILKLFDSLFDKAKGNNNFERKVVCMGKFL